MKTTIEPQERECAVAKNIAVRTSGVTSRLTGMLTYSANSPDGGHSSNQLKESYVEIENMCSQLANTRILCEKRLHAKSEKISQFTALHGTSQSRMLQAVQEATYKAKLRNRALVERMEDMKDTISHVVGDVATDNGLHRAQEAYKSKLTIALPAHISGLAMRESFLSQPHMQLPELEVHPGPGTSANRRHLAVNDAEQLFQIAHSRAMGWANNQKHSHTQAPQREQDQNQTGISSASSSSRSHSRSHVDSDASTVAFGIRSTTLNSGYNSKSHASISSSNNEDSNMFVYSDSDNNGNSSTSHISSNSPRSLSHSSSSSSGNGNSSASGLKHRHQTDKSYSLFRTDHTAMATSNINSDSNATKSNNITASSGNMSSSRLNLAESDEDSLYGNRESSDARDALREDIDINDTNRQVADATLESSLYFAFTVTGGGPPYRVPTSPGGFRAGSSSPGSAARGQRSPVTRQASPSVRVSPNAYGAAYGAQPVHTTAESAMGSPGGGGGGAAAAAAGSQNRSKTAEFSNLFDEDEFEDEDVIRSAPVLVDLETTMNSNK